MSKISVIVPIYNALNDLKILLKSLVKNFNFELGEIFLINDFSNQETSEYLSRFVAEHVDFKLLNNEENLGFVKTCNRGMKLASGDIVVLLNSDTEIPTNFCERIIKCFEHDKKIGIASPISSHSWLFYISLPKNYSLEKMNLKLRQKHKCSYPLIHAAEGFCFCIRKEVIEQQGYLDEIYGKGYNEEVDFAYRAITNGWKNVLIDDLYVYHKRHASFGVEQREILLKQNSTVCRERWQGFKENYEKENNLVNPVIKIEQKMFPIRTFFFKKKIKKGCSYNFFEELFSIKNSNDKKHKIIAFLGVKLSIKKSLKTKQPPNCKNIKKIFNYNLKNNKKIAAVLAMHNNYGFFDDNLVDYLTEIRKHVGYIILVSDHPICIAEIKKIDKIADAVILKKHKEYDFGSYKRGFNLLTKIGLTNRIQNIVFMNDSVMFVGDSLEKPFLELKDNDFYGITQHAYGYTKNKVNDYGWIYSPHIQSYFFSVSSKIFREKWFNSFIQNIKYEKNKKDIIINYEMGLSKLILNKGYSLNSYYPEIKEDIDPCNLYLKKENAQIFIKKKFL